MRDRSNSRVLVIMVKEPIPGAVKTRLGRDIGNIPAAGWYRKQAARLVRSLSRDPRWSTVLAVSPDRSAVTGRVWPPSIPRLPQGRGNLGARIRRVMQFMPAGPVALIGSDIPGIRPAHIDRAFRILGMRDVVFGPSPDGGFWLVGMRRMRPLAMENFRGVRWSTEHALQDACNSLRHLTIGMTDSLADVDTIADLQTARFDCTVE